jgi:ABC-type cobalamin/Fe3+-siderophores transport system ATPase subunit
MLDFAGTTYRYREGVAVNGVTLRIPERQLVALVGENGSGKSTLLKLAARVLQPESGDVRLDGKPLRQWAPREYAKRVGYLAQEQELPFAMNALDVVVSGRAPFLGRFGWESEQDFEEARRALELCDASHLAERDVEEMSGGERKRVFLARVLAARPSLIILDEPFAALDLSHVQRFSALLREVVDRTGATVLFASHDLNWAAAYADRMLVMHHGSLVVDGTAAEVMQAGTMKRYFGFESVSVVSGDRTWIVPA